MNSSEFVGSRVGEDPRNFINEVKKILEVMQVTGNESVELGSYQLKDVAHIWFTQWKKNRGNNATLMIWDCLLELFILNPKHYTLYFKDDKNALSFHLYFSVLVLLELAGGMPQQLH
ncbi:hypothetical protein MTR67_043368 [Solanum verrucosum]|uniref:Gag-pol polyprotein n=1 Tax=Solanum verrucosum TaxID=315347 RepID=A0AAF0ZU86_SOLVR|nr:hypothetical protein MTR67_043368 [Solanum verrucosum]